MRSRLERQCIDVMHANTVQSFSNQVAAFVNDCDLEIFTATVITDHSPTLTEFQSCSNVPEKYLDSFLDIPAGKRDPVSQFCKTSSSPLFWNHQTYIDADCNDLWDHQAPFGFKEGISLAIHLPRGRHFFFGAMGNRVRKGKPHEFRNFIVDLQLFASHAQAAAFELCSPSRADVCNDWSLTNGELEALRWSMSGNSELETAKKMSISESMVLLRLGNAMRKLNCGTKYEAILKAIRLGLIICR